MALDLFGVHGRQYRFELRFPLLRESTVQRFVGLRRRQAPFARPQRKPQVSVASCSVVQRRFARRSAALRLYAGKSEAFQPRFDLRRLRGAGQIDTVGQARLD